MWALGIALLAAVAATTSPEVPVPLSIVEGRLLVVSVRLDGSGPFQLLLDTGSNTTILDPSVARRLGLRMHDTATLVGLGGQAVARRARIGRLTIGPKSVDGLEVLVTELAGIHRLGSRIVGVLGQDVLGRFDYLVSYERRQLSFDVKDVEAGLRVPFERYYGRMVVEVALGDEGKARRFVLDSAASAVFVFDRRTRGAGVWHEDGSVEVLTTRGPRAHRPVRLDRLAIAGREVTGLRAVLVDDPQRLAAASEDGLLPTSLFASVYFDNGDRSVVLTPGRNDWRVRR